MFIITRIATQMQYIIVFETYCLHSLCEYTHNIYSINDFLNLGTLYNPDKNPSLFLSLSQKNLTDYFALCFSQYWFHFFVLSL